MTWAPKSKRAFEGWRAQHMARFNKQLRRQMRPWRVLFFAGALMTLGGLVYALIALS